MPSRDVERLLRGNMMPRYVLDDATPQRPPPPPDPPTQSYWKPPADWQRLTDDQKVEWVKARLREVVDAG